MLASGIGFPVGVNRCFFLIDLELSRYFSKILASSLYFIIFFQFTKRKFFNINSSEFDFPLEGGVNRVLLETTKLLTIHTELSQILQHEQLHKINPQNTNLKKKIKEFPLAVHNGQLNWILSIGTFNQLID